MAKTSNDEPANSDFSSGLETQINLKSFVTSENITVLNLSHSNINLNNEEITLPPNIRELDLSYNELIEVPKFVVEMDCLKILNISSNNIEYFDDTPKFCDTLEQLNISRNRLEGPPLWIWLCTPRNLLKLDISYNPKITSSLKSESSAHIYNSKTHLTDVDIHNCKINLNLTLLSTFSNAKFLTVGDRDYDYHTVNKIIEVPCEGLDKCCDVNVLNLCNTNVYTINSNIDIFKHIVYMDLSLNNIHSLPNEFCNLSNLEILLFSCNKLSYLPDEIHKLTKLTILLLDSNKLCMLPESINYLDHLKVLDIYDNCLHEVCCNINHLEEVDFAQNYFEELKDDIYMLKKNKLRQNRNGRCNGRKADNKESDEEHSVEDEDLYNVSGDECPTPECGPPSSPDWDSDDYWIPRYNKPNRTQFSYYLKQGGGNITPSDILVRTVDVIKSQSLMNSANCPYESDGQFDDLSDDEN